ncbi:hypothetical protein [Bradyrhizobium sp. STM 3561]|uniref:hypothetical protein n=1 Tax=Bradyrhizobium sp. STM 3561 TaxID=578923 RepID=UPI00388D143A
MHTGTVNFATVLTVPAALALHQEIGAPAKRSFNDVEILAPDEADLYGAITSFRIQARRTSPTTTPLAQLRDSYNVFTVLRGVAKGQCISMTPAIYTEEADLDRLVEALALITGTKAG